MVCVQGVKDASVILLISLHALPLGLLDHACTQAGPTSSLERKVTQHTHTCLINQSNAAFTNLPYPCGLLQWTSLQGRPHH